MKKRVSYILAGSIGALAITAVSSAQAAPGFGVANQLSSQSSSSTSESRSTKSYNLIEMLQQFVHETLDPPKPYLGVYSSTSSNSPADHDKAATDCEDSDKTENAEEEEERAATSGPEPIYFGF